MSRPRPAASAVFWGAVWAAVLGSWLLAPRLADVHRLTSASAVEWVVFGAALLVVFCLLGALVGFETGLLLVVWEKLRRRPFADLRAAFAVAMPSLLTLGYVAGGAVIEFRAFGRLLGIGQRSDVVGAAALWLGATSIAPFVYRAVRHRRALPIASMLGVVALVGLLALPWRVTGSAPPAAVPSPALGRSSESAPPLLLVGIDSANWRVLDPLIESGRVPFFASLVASGSSGEVRAPWPPYWSAPAWAAMLTGYPPEETGIHDDLVLRAPGLPRLAVPLVADLLLAPIFQVEYALAAAQVLRMEKPTRTMLRREPIWQMATRAGARTAVVRFMFTHPARGEATYLVSDHAGDDEWAPMGVPASESGELAFPPESADALLKPFLREDDAEPSALAEVFPPRTHPRPADAFADPIEILTTSLRTDERVLRASEHLAVTHPDLDLLALYLGGFDVVCHVFWPYRFPEDFPDDPPAAHDVAVLGPVVDRYLELLDRRLGRLAASFAGRANVVIVADHGAEASRGRTLWPGWHAERGGVFLLGGPSVPRRSGRMNVSYFDVTPTVLDLLGFRAPWLEHGTSLLMPR